MYARENRPASAAQITTCHLGDQLAALNPSTPISFKLETLVMRLDTELSVLALILSYIPLARDQQLPIRTLSCLALILLSFVHFALTKAMKCPDL